MSFHPYAYEKILCEIPFGDGFIWLFCLTITNPMLYCAMHFEILHRDIKCISLCTYFREQCIGIKTFLNQIF